MYEIKRWFLFSTMLHLCYTISSVKSLVVFELYMFWSCKHHSRARELSTAVALLLRLPGQQQHVSYEEGPEGGRMQQKVGLVTEVRRVNKT